MIKIRYILAGLSLASMVVSAQEQKTEKLSGSIIGRFYLDGTAFIKTEEPLGSGASFGDIRLGVKGKYQQFSGKLEIGFAKDRVSLKDIFIQYNFKPNSFIRAGHFAEPLGIDYMESSASIRFISSDPATNAFAAGRSLGAGYIGWRKYFWYAGGFFGDNHFQNKINYLEEDGYAVTGRLVYTPSKSKGSILHIGVASSLRIPDPEKEGSDRDVTFKTNIGSITNDKGYVGTTIKHVRNTCKLVGELLGAADRFCLQSEYFYTRTNRTNNLKAYNAMGVYGQIGFLAIGGPYEYAGEWARLKQPGVGSLEFAARFSYLNLNDKGSSILGGEQQQITLGCNYYWKKFITFRLNYGHTYVNTEELNGSFNFISGRIQVYFQ